MIKVLFIGHSGYLIELDQHVLLFDYYRGEIPEIDPAKKLYVFVSHRHPDHYNEKIFEMFRDFPDVTFILSKDIWKKPMMYHVKFMKPGQFLEMEDGGRIWTFRSTDEGVAFLVKCGNTFIYHAGDLNWWHWEGEPGNYNDMMRINYQKEIDSMNEILREENAELDVACVVLDERLGDAYSYGMQYFLETVPARHVFPMHFFENGYGVCRRLAESNINGRGKVFSITEPGMEFEL